jgi:hypothetical protein
MDTQALDPLGYITLSQFVTLHEHLVTQLRKKFEELGETCPELASPKKVKLHKDFDDQITYLQTWAYGMGTPPMCEHRANQHWPTFEQLYAAHHVVQDFVKLLDRAKFNFGKKVYDIKLKLKASEYYEVDSRLYLYGLFLIFSSNIEQAPHLNKANKYWLNAPPASGRATSVAKSPDASATPFHRFIGFYFSVVGFKVKWILLSVSKQPFPDTDGKYLVVEKWFHSLEAKDDEPEYSGLAIKTSEGYFFANNLKGEHEDRYMNIIWNMKDSGGFDNLRFFLASLQGISKHRGGRLLSLELFCCAIKEEQYLEFDGLRKNGAGDNINLVEKGVFRNEQELAHLSFYLSFQRRLFAIRPDSFRKIDDLKVRQNDIKTFGFLPGIYRILQFGFRRKEEIIVKRGKTVLQYGTEPGEKKGITGVSLIQSRLEIGPDGTGRLMTKVNGDEKEPSDFTFNCVLNPTSKPRPKKVCIYAFNPKSLQICNFAILDFDTETSHSNIHQGIFSSVGWSRKGIFGGYMTFQNELHVVPRHTETKEAEKKRLDFQPEYIDPENVEAFIIDNGLSSLYDELKKIWLEKGRNLFQFLFDEEEKNS